MLITDDYKRQQRLMHATIPSYGTSSHQFAAQITRLIDSTGATELLDYGCGKGLLAQTIKPGHRIRITQYDPGIPELDDMPDSHQIVACTDVLEHIEPDCLDAVLDDLKRVTELAGFFSVHTGAAAKTLPDGRNAHLIQEGPEWWLPKIMQRFDLIAFQDTGNGFFVVVRPKHGIS